MRFMPRNRMSKQEIKEEYRQNEGDPAIKAKIRQIRHLIVFVRVCVAWGGLG